MQYPECKNKNILVTGGAGFMGSHLVDRLSVGNKVIVLDNLSTGLMVNLERSKDRITFVEGNIRDVSLVKDIVGKVELVFHLAARVGVMGSIKDSYSDMEVNIKGTLNLLEACRNSRVERFVYSSSAAIFGEVAYLPIDEKHPFNPQSPYAVSKLAAENYCLVFHKVYGVPITVLRYFNVYGLRQDFSEYSDVISIFFSRVREGKPLTIFGDGRQTRDFVFVEDVVNANILAVSQSSAVGEVFNIGIGQSGSIEQLASIIKQVSSKESEIIYANPRVGEVRHSVANIEKARRVLGYNPKISLKEGLSLIWNKEKRNG